MRGYEHIEHNFEPVYDSKSKILILGSLPSVKSREQQFYYAHPQNRFWRVLAAVFGGDVPETTDEKKDFLLKNKIALWDVIDSCDIHGSSDSSIRNVVPNNLNIILDNADIEKICLNGGKAYELFHKYFDCINDGEVKYDILKLPSTSPANASWGMERLVEEWMNISKICK